MNSTDDRPKQPNDRSGGVRPAYARLKEEQQRVVGGGRWSVDGSRRCCHVCQQEIVRGTPFWTVLRATDEEPTEPDSVAAFFCRQDHCESCIDSLEPGQHYARWKTSVPAPHDPPRTIVNIASLQATFLSLLEVESTESKPQQPDDADRQQPSEVASSTTTGLRVSKQADRERLAYLLALFLVRKRALRWEQHQGDHLVVRERGGNLHRVPVPRIDSQVLEQAIAEFEQLFG
ncbi:MAG: hypothetical protein AAEJ65_08740 [Planctomycetota bacterium]